MRKKILTAIAAALMATTSYATVDTVKRVVDGDTIHTTNAKVRFSFIDTPESKNNSRVTRILKNECKGVDRNHMIDAGKISSRELNKMVSIGDKVTLDVKSKDRYGRVVADINFKGTSLNSEMLKRGYAVAYLKYIKKKDKKKYAQMQKNAKQNNLGLWKTHKKVMNCLTLAAK